MEDNWQKFWNMDKEEAEDFFSQSHEELKNSLSELGTLFAQLMEAIEYGQWGVTMVLAETIASSMSLITNIAKSHLAYKDLIEKQ